MNRFVLAPDPDVKCVHGLGFIVYRRGFVVTWKEAILLWGTTFKERHADLDAGVF